MNPASRTPRRCGRVCVLIAVVVLLLSGTPTSEAAARRLRNAVYGGTSEYAPRHVEFGDRSFVADDWDSLWKSTGAVPFSVPGVPPRKAFVDFPSGISVRPNDTFTTGLMRQMVKRKWADGHHVAPVDLTAPLQLLQFPDITYEAYSDDLHTVFIADLDIYQPGSPIKNYIHFMATNVPGDDVRRGDINFRYLPPFAFLLGENSTLIRDGNFGHRFAVLVYQQPFRKRVTWPKEDNWCSSKGVFGRLRNFADIVSLLFLNAVPTAGNFFVVRYSFETTDKFLCIVSKCTKSPFPTNIAGVNSGPSCGTKNKFA